MKKIKKIISTIVSFTLALSVNISAFGEDTAEEIKAEASIEVKEETKLSGVDFVLGADEESIAAIYQKLINLQIFKYVSEINFDDVLTRGEFAQLVSNIIFSGKSAQESPSRFVYSDIDETHENYGAIVALTNRGIISGDGEGNFRVDENITTSEACVILLNTLGYYEIAGMCGGYPKGYYFMGTKLGFTKDVSISNDNELKTGEAVKLIYRAMHERMALADSYETDTSNFKVSDDTAMYYYMGIKTIEGIATANENTSLYNKDGAVGKNMITVNDESLRLNPEKYDAANYLGLYVRAYYRDESGANDALLIECIKSRNKTEVIKADKIENYNDATNILSYTDKNERMKTVQIPVTANLIFNGVSMTGEIPKEFFTPGIGQIVLLDNNNDSVYDVIFIDYYVQYVAKKEPANEEDSLYDELSVQDALDFEDMNVRVYCDNQRISVTDIKTEDVVLAAPEKIKIVNAQDNSKVHTYALADAGSESARLIVSKNVAKGIFDGYDASENAATIDGIEYKISSGFFDAAFLKTSTKAVDSRTLGVNTTAGLDALGNIAYMIKSSSEAVKYGYLVKLGMKNNISSSVEAKIYTQDDEMLTADFSSKVKVYRKWSSGNINTSTYYSKRLDNSEILELPELINGSQTVCQLLQYKVDDEGKIDTLYIAGRDERSYLTDVPQLESSILYLSHSIGTDAHYAYNFTNYGMVIDPLFEYSKLSTYGFCVPSDNTIDDPKYFDVYHNQKINLFVNGSRIINMDMYNVDNGIIGAFVYKKDVGTSEGDASAEFSSSSDNVDIVIESAKQVRDAETDEYKTVITGWSYSGTYGKFEFTSPELISLENENVPQFSKIPVNELRKGDLILAHKNGLDQIDGFKVGQRVQYAIEHPNEDGNITPMEISWNGKALTGISMYIESYACGEVVKTVDGIPYVNTGRSDGLLRRMRLYGSGTRIIYDYKNKTMAISEKNDFSDIEEGDFLFYHQYDRATKVAVALRNYK